jgi:ubiquinone/menaquinone biosynthesis C-methylase UbiE
MLVSIPPSVAHGPHAVATMMSLATEYDRWHKDVFESGPEHADESAPWYRLVLEYLGNLEGKGLLEIACGRGGFSCLLAARGARVAGVDFSGAALKLALHKTAGNGHGPAPVNFIQADAQRLPFASEAFDVVISCETIEHLPDPEASLAEMARVCRSNGLLYLTTPNYVNANGLYYLYARARGKKATPGGDQPFDRVFLFPQIRKMVRRAGWEIIQTDGTVHQFPVWPGHNPVAMPRLESNRTVRRILSPFALHFFVMARKIKAH